MDEEEDYQEKTRQIFKYINDFRRNPKLLGRHLEKMKQYLDPNTKVLSEPNKIQIQMVEGESVIDEAIRYLNNLAPLTPLQWDSCLQKSAEEHVNDIGPKGLLLYQSSDGTEPEDRICKYGNYVDSLGENIDFGPNDAMGVIVSLVLDDGEDQRPHRENIFKSDYHKVGIACGPHQSEFQMCVMDFAYDFLPKDSTQNKRVSNKQINNNLADNPVVNLALNDNNNNNNNMNVNNNKGNRSFQNNNNNILGDLNQDLYMQDNQMNLVNNQSPLVKLSLDNDYTKYKLDAMKQNQSNNNEMRNQNNINNNPNISKKSNNTYDEFQDWAEEVKKINLNKKVIKRTVEVTTKITYTYNDNSTKEVQDKQTHTFHY